MTPIVRFSFSRYISVSMTSITSLPNDFLSYSGDRFYDFVTNFVGEIEMNILRVQCIGNVRTVSHVTDVFAFFKLNCEETSVLKAQACFVTDDNVVVVKTGIRSNMEYFLTLLQSSYPSLFVNGISSSCQITYEQLHGDSPHYPFNGITRLDDKKKTTSPTSFSQIFIENFAKNMNRSSNNYEYNPSVEKFALALHIMGGNNAYEFIRINLPGSSPSQPKLKQVMRNTNANLYE